MPAKELEVGCVVGVKDKRGGFLVRRIEDDGTVHCHGPHPLFSGAIKKAPASRAFRREQLSTVRLTAAEAARKIERRDT